MSLRSPHQIQMHNNQRMFHTSLRIPALRDAKLPHSITLQKIQGALVSPSPYCRLIPELRSFQCICRNLCWKDCICRSKAEVIICFSKNPPHTECRKNIYAVCLSLACLLSKISPHTESHITDFRRYHFSHGSNI